MMKIGQRIHNRVSKWWERDMEGRKVNMKPFKIKISYAESSDTGYIR